MTWGKGSKLDSKLCFNSLIVQPNLMKLGTITNIYSIGNRAKRQRDSSNRHGERIRWVFTPVPPCHRVHSKEYEGPEVVRFG